MSTDRPILTKLVDRLRLAIASFAFLLPALLVGQEVERAIAQGDRAAAELHPLAALSFYESAIALNPNSVVALARASKTAVDAGEQTNEKGPKMELFRKGERYARLALQHDSTDAELHFHLARALGRAALSVGVRDRVRYAVEIRAVTLAALARDPNHPGALHILGMWNAEVMRLNGVERFVAKNLLGGKVFGLASWHDAVENLEHAVRVDPTRLTHRLDLAKIYVDIGEKAKAREQLQRVLDGPAVDVNDPIYQREAQEVLRRLR